MGKLKTFDINFDNFQGVYFAGETVKGHVTLELLEPMKMRELRLTCFGRAHVHWSELENVGRRGGRQRLETVEYTAEEDYFKQKCSLWGKEVNPDESDSISAGKHTFPFELLLPADVPSSFEGNYGYVRYWIKATIDKPWKFDHHTKRAFTVIADLDLADEPKASEPIRCQGEVNAGCWCCNCGGYSAVFCANCRGCVPGEILLLYTEVENNTRWSNCSAEIRLKLVVTYYTERKTRQEKKVITRLKRDRLSIGNCEVWSDAFKIPPLPPSHLNGCRIITTQYILQFIVETDGCNCDAIEFEKELIVGTIPLRGGPPPMIPPVVPNEPPPKYTPHDHLKNAKLHQRRLSPEAPPSYEECVFGRVNIKDKDDSDYTQGTLVFAPLYACYNSEITPEDNAD